MSRKRGGRNEVVPTIAPVYEGPAVLDALLRRAGSPHGTEEVAQTFRRAHEAGEPRSAVIPGLFPGEPHFESPEAARRLYSNLFGLWARVASGQGAHDDAPEVVAEPPAQAPLPERGTEEPGPLTPELVDAVWKHLAALSPRELQRRRDRFINVQPDLVAYLEAAPLPDSGGLAANDLVFEAWVMFDQAFGDRLSAVELKDLIQLDKEPPPPVSVEPALAAYVDEQLDNLADEDPAFGPGERAQVERLVATVISALSDAVRQPS